MSALISSQTVSINVSKNARKHINADYSPGHNGRSFIPSAGDNFEKWNYHNYANMRNCKYGGRVMVIAMVTQNMIIW